MTDFYKTCMNVIKFEATQGRMFYFNNSEITTQQTHTIRS